MQDEERSIWFTKLLYAELAINTIDNVSIGHRVFMSVHGSEAKLHTDLDLGTSSDILSK